MKTLNAIALSCLLSCLLAGCGDGKEAAAPPPNRTRRHQKRDADHDDARGARARCGRTGRRSRRSVWPRGSRLPSGKAWRWVTGGLQSKVTPGTYCVCESGSAKHDGLKADHLVKDEAVVIPAFVKDGAETVDWVTAVQLGATAVQMRRSVDETELNTLVRYSHKDVNTQQDEDVTHSVSITPYKPGPSGAAAAWLRRWQEHTDDHLLRQEQKRRMAV